MMHIIAGTWIYPKLEQVPLEPRKRGNLVSLPSFPSFSGHAQKEGWNPNVKTQTKSRKLRKPERVPVRILSSQYTYMYVRTYM